MNNSKKKHRKKYRKKDSLNKIRASKWTVSKMITKTLMMKMRAKENAFNWMIQHKLWIETVMIVQKPRTFYTLLGRCGRFF